MKYIRQNKPIEKPISNGTKRNMTNVYAVFCRQNDVKFKKPKYHYEPPTIQIPRTDDIDAIINNTSKEAITGFKIMKETAIEATELNNIDITMIDTSKPNAVKTVKALNNTTTAFII